MADTPDTTVAGQPIQVRVVPGGTDSRDVVADITGAGDASADGQRPAGPATGGHGDADGPAAERRAGADRRTGWDDAGAGPGTGTDDTRPGADRRTDADRRTGADDTRRGVHRAGRDRPARRDRPVDANRPADVDASWGGLDPAAGTPTPATAQVPAGGRVTGSTPGLAAARSTRRGDAVFRGLSSSAGITVLAIMAAIAVFLIYRAIPALRADDGNFFTTKDWFPDPSEPGGTSVFGIAALAFHTVVTSVIGMVLAVPVAVGIALFITYYAPRRLASALGYVVDLLAAVPSIVFGLWGAFFLAPNLDSVTLFLDRWLGWTVLFDYRPESLPANKSDFTAGIVLAIMILPIVSALAREVFRQVPSSHVEGALALGATRWEMIRMSVLPFGRAGVVSAAILGLGRALGETLAVTLILASAYNLSFHILENGGVTFASNIALKYNEAGSVGTGALIASGMVLFVLTLAVNSASQLLLRRQLKD